MSGGLAAGFFPGGHRFTLRVYIEDISGGEHVYNGQYLRFLERARTELFRAADELDGIADRPPYHHYLVAAVEQRFLKAASLHDVLTVTTRLGHVGRSSCVLDHVVRRGDDEIATARLRLVFTIAGWPAQQPTAWIDRFRQLTGDAERPSEP